MSDSNSRDGDYFETTDQMMAAYDQLPPEVRQAVAEAPVQWATTPLLKQYRRTRNAAAVAQSMRDANRWIFGALEFNRARALGVYRGNHPEIVDGWTRPLRWRQFQKLVIESDLTGGADQSEA